MTRERFERLQLDLDNISRRYDIGYLMNLEDDNLVVKFEINAKSGMPEDEYISSTKYM